VKVWLLDNGSIVIEHTQLMWNVPGPQVRLPVYSVLVEHDQELILFDTGIDLDHMNRVLPFELPEQTPEQTIPAQLELCGFELAVDVAYTATAYEKGIQPGFHHTPVDGVRSIARIKSLAEQHGADVYFSHDMDAWNTYRHAPDFYEL